MSCYKLNSLLLGLVLGCLTGTSQAGSGVDYASQGGAPTEYTSSTNEAIGQQPRPTSTGSLNESTQNADTQRRRQLDKEAVAQESLNHQ